MENEGLRKLCEQAGKEQDPRRLMELVQEIVRLLNASPLSKPANLAKDLSGAA